MRGPRLCLDGIFLLQPHTFRRLVAMISSTEPSELVVLALTRGGGDKLKELLNKIWKTNRNSMIVASCCFCCLLLPLLLDISTDLKGLCQTLLHCHHGRTNCIVVVYCALVFNMFAVALAVGKILEGVI